MTVSIQGMNKAQVLAAAVNACQPLGMGWHDPNAYSTMTGDQAAELLAKRTYFDYVWGRPVKISLASDEVDPAMYDRDQGQGAFARVVESVSAGLLA
jgi:hypothetical protein